MKVVDLFAGAGGFSTGAAMAGAEVIWAANHWRAAVDVHQQNHPGAYHACQDLHQADWSQVPKHDILLASPACQGHSKARGKERASHDAARATAWAVVSALECHRTPVALVENVPEFLDWALYPAWALALSRLGYRIGKHVVDSADFGVPQERVRAFLVLTRSKAPLKLEFEKRPHVPVDTILRWEEGRWSQIDKPGRSPWTAPQARAAQVANGGERGIFAYYSSERKAARGRLLSRPMGTVTTRARFALVRDDQMRMVMAREYLSAMGFPSEYLLPKKEDLAIHLLGNAVVPEVAKNFILKIKERG